MSYTIGKDPKDKEYGVYYDDLRDAVMAMNQAVNNESKKIYIWRYSDQLNRFDLIGGMTPRYHRFVEFHATRAEAAIIKGR